MKEKTSNLKEKDSKGRGLGVPIKNSRKRGQVADIATSNRLLNGSGKIRPLKKKIVLGERNHQKEEKTG